MMAALVIALIESTNMNDEVRTYLEEIDTTLEPYGGHYRIHGGPYLPLEGQWEGDLVLLERVAMLALRIRKLELGLVSGQTALEVRERLQKMRKTLDTTLGELSRHDASGAYSDQPNILHLA